MAKLYQGIDGPFSGKVGPVVGYIWKRTPCMRAYPAHVNYPNTPSQQQERDWFISMVRFASQARTALLLGFNQKALANGMTEGNYFVTKNKDHFHRTDEGVEIDYEQLSLAEGPAADVLFHTPVFRDHQTVSVDFDRNTLFSRASGDDMVYLYLYSVDLARGYFAAPVTRRTKNISLQLPSEWSGTLIHIYGFVVDRDGRSSNSTYIGAGMVDHYNDGTAYIPLNKSWIDFVEVANKVNASTASENTPVTAAHTTVDSATETPPE